VFHLLNALSRSEGRLQLALVATLHLEMGILGQKPPDLR
jgi:hypothetical protein